MALVRTQQLNLQRDWYRCNTRQGPEEEVTKIRDSLLTQITPPRAIFRREASECCPPDTATAASVTARASPQPFVKHSTLVLVRGKKRQVRSRLWRQWHKERSHYTRPPLRSATLQWARPTSRAISPGQHDYALLPGSPGEAARKTNQLFRCAQLSR